METHFCDERERKKSDKIAMRSGAAQRLSDGRKKVNLHFCFPMSSFKRSRIKMILPM